jgi:hypothetical protein
MVEEEHGAERLNMNEMKLRRYLRKHSKKRISLTLTDNGKSIMTASYPSEDMVNLTLHGMFLDAPFTVLRALARFVKKPDLKKQKDLSKLFHSNGLNITKKTKLKKYARLKHQGKCFNLKDIYDKINQRYFKNRVKAFITWGNENSKKRRYSISYGSYNWDSRIIRIHKTLDRYSIPKFFIEYIVYHEMLHVDIGLKRDGRGKRKAHSKEFQEREKEFLHYQKAVMWEKKNLWRFINAKRH